MELHPEDGVVGKEMKKRWVKEVGKFRQKSNHKNHFARVQDGLNSGVSNPQPPGHMGPRMAMNVAQHKVVSLLRTL